MKKHLTTLHVVHLFVGSIIGSGIFLIPSIVASHTATPFYFIIVWVIAGLITLAGSMTHAELSLHIPVSGGQYPIIKYLFGKNIAQVYGWTGILNFNSGGIACIAFIAATYLNQLFGGPMQAKHLAIILIILLTSTNLISLKISDGLQTQLTILRIVMVILLASMAFGYTPTAEEASISNEPAQQAVYPFILAIIGALWAYDGWNNFTYVAGEVIDLRAAILKAIPIGIGIVVVLYTLFNAALIHVFPLQKIADTNAIGSLLISHVHPGLLGERAIIAAIILCTVGSLNANIMACSRLPYAVGIDSNYFKILGKEHPKTGTPWVALVTQSLISCLCIWFLPFEILAISIVLTSRLFYILSGSALIILRLKKKEPTELRIPIAIPFFFVGFNILLIIVFLHGLISIQ